MNINEEKDFGYIEYSTGISLEIPEGYFGSVRPRSSIRNTGLILANSPGTIDSGYRGDLVVCFKYIKGTKLYKPGDRIAQLVILPYPEVELIESEELAPSERSESAFGSSGS
jgi:dUTP pyrophosphatase